HFLSRFDQALTAGVPGCRAGRASFSIDPAGYVAICVEHHSRPIGNIHRDHTQQLIRRLRQAAAVNRCSQCWYNCRGEVEMLYHPPGLLRSLPNLLFDRGQPAIDRSIDATCPAPPANATNPARAYV
ncbi:MAG: SPASM domain-containing protein, partial [Phycisphaerae bacterium]